MAFSFELKLAISSELYGAISAGPEQASGENNQMVDFTGPEHLLWRKI